MKRVLLVAYFFPPQPKAGALRLKYLADNLAAFGWQPTVLTVEYPGDPGVSGRVVRTRQLGVRTDTANQPGVVTVPKRRSPAMRFVREAVKSVIFFPDQMVGWLPTALPAAHRLAREEKFDAVLSSAPPPVDHIVAHSVAQRHKIPWIADYRDLWAGPYGPYFSRKMGRTRLALSYALERHLLKKAAAITAPSEGHARALAEYFQRADVELIPNAADPHAWESIADAPPASFTLCHTGTFYETFRTPDVLLGAIKLLRDRNRPAGAAARLLAYGENPHLALEPARKLGIEDAVTAFGVVERERSLRAQREAAVLVLLLNTTGERDSIEASNPGSKILEYVGARRPILALGSADNAMAPFLGSTGLGYFASDEAGCAQAIESLYERFVGGEFGPPSSNGWTPPTPRDLAGRFAQVLDRVTARGTQEARSL
jgi:glycosyltransferase involved in cell wall biosynthesis